MYRLLFCSPASLPPLFPLHYPLSIRADSSIRVDGAIAVAIRHIYVNLGRFCALRWQLQAEHGHLDRDDYTVSRAPRTPTLQI